MTTFLIFLATWWSLAGFLVFVKAPTPKTTKECLVQILACGPISWIWVSLTIPFVALALWLERRAK